MLGSIRVARCSGIPRQLLGLVGRRFWLLINPLSRNVIRDIIGSTSCGVFRQLVGVLDSRVKLLVSALSRDTPQELIGGISRGVLRQLVAFMDRFRWLLVSALSRDGPRDINGDTMSRILLVRSRTLQREILKCREGNGRRQRRDTLTAI